MWAGFNSEEPSSSIGNVIFHIDTYKVMLLFLDLELSLFYFING
jgi:hypothetical protein